MKLGKVLVASLLVLGLAACQQDEPEEPKAAETEEQTKTEADKDTAAESTEKAEEEPGLEEAISEEDLIALPETDQDLISQPVGKIGHLDLSSGDEEEIEPAFFEAFGEVPPLKEDASEEEVDLYFNY